MPRYFIDLQDGADFYKDDEGSEVSDAQDARTQALQALSQISRDELPKGEHRHFVTTVRDDKGLTLYRATLTLTGEWLPTSPD